MAEFTAETATIEAVFVRRALPNGESEYVRRPFNLVTYDDGNQYIEPISTGVGPYTYGDSNPVAASVSFRIEDSEPFAGVTEVR